MVFLTGFVDGDGCFTYQISRSRNRKLGYQVQLVFSIDTLGTPENLTLLKHFQSLFNGNIINKENLLVYKVTRIEDLLKVKENFLTYTLQTSKILHFNAWSSMLDIILKGPLNTDSLESIISLTGHFPKGMNPNLKRAFPHVVPCTPFEFVVNPLALNPNWIAGFIAADGSFSISLRRTEKKVKLVII